MIYSFHYNMIVDFKPRVLHSLLEISILILNDKLIFLKI